MNDRDEYRGISYTLPHNDDGEWRVIIHSKTLKRFPEFNIVPRMTYASREAAIVEVHRRIDAIV